MNSKKEIKIVFTGGGTGGHIFPLIAVIEEIKNLLRNNEKLKFWYIGPKNKYFIPLLSEQGIKIKIIFSGKWRRYWEIKAFFQNILDIFKFLIGFFQSLFLLHSIKPDLIFSKGGYGSLPVVIAGFFKKIPIFLHESDITCGFSNKILAKFSKKIFISFHETKGLPKEKLIFTGNPIRKVLLKGAEEKKEFSLNLTEEKPILLVLGGSQGAQRINELIFQILPEILNEFEIIHQVGIENFKKFKERISLKLKNSFLKRYYHPIGFLNVKELGFCYSKADLIINRAGSGSIFEISAFGKPSILIPLPESAQNHQLENARYYEKRGACVVLEEKEITTPFILLKKIRELKNDPERLKEMSKKAKEFSQIEAGKKIAEIILKELKIW